MNPKFLIQLSKTLPIELTGTHYLRPIWYPYLSNNFHISNTLFHPHVFQKTTKISSQTTLPNIRQCFKFLDLQSLNSELCFFLFSFCFTKNSNFQFYSNFKYPLKHLFNQMPDTLIF